MSSTVFLHLLGEFELLYQSSPDSPKQALLKPPTKKSISLLAYLATQRNQRFTRDHLIEMFWGDRPENKARRSLTTALWQIRVCIPDDTFLYCTAQYIKINPDYRIVLDTDDFKDKSSTDRWDDLTASLLLYRGEFLEGLYDDWIINARYQFENLYLDVLSRVMQNQLSSGQYQPALETAQLLIKHDALREDAYRGAMLCHHHLGQKPAVLKVFHQCQNILDREIGARPEAETIDLFQKLIASPLPQEVQAADEYIEGEVLSKPRVTFRSDGPTLDQFIGRASELYELEQCWIQACQGNQRFALVKGVTGIGKSRLCEEFSKIILYQGGRLLRAHFYEFEQGMLYQPILEVLRDLRASLTKKELLAYPNWVLDELAQLIPEIRPDTARMPTTSNSVFDHNQTRLFESILWFLRPFLSHNGTLFILEDMHWCRDSTLMLIRYLAHNLENYPILFIGTLRSEEIYRQPALGSFCEELASAGKLRELNLLPLSLSALDTFTRDCLSSSGVASRLSKLLYRETEGNPLYLVHLIRYMFEAGMLWQSQEGLCVDTKRIITDHLPVPSTFKQVIQTRVSHLGITEQEILNAASIAGRIIDFDVLKHIAGKGEAEVMKALNAFLRNGLIRACDASEDGDYSFTHSKICDSLYSAIDRRQRSFLHARIAHVLEGIYAGRTDQVATELAYHYVQGRIHDRSLSERAVFFLLKVGDRARSLAAYQEAIESYQRAMEIVQESQDLASVARIYFKLGLVYHLAYDFVSANDSYARGFEMQKLLQRAQKEKTAPGQGVLRISTPPVLTLDPLLAYDLTSTEIIQQLFAGLVEANQDMDILPSIAERWEIGEDGRNYVFYLRKDACWSDGSHVTAYDFERSFHTILAPDSESLFASTFYFMRGGKAGQECPQNFSIKTHAQDSNTLILELLYPSGYFLYQLLFFLPRPVEITNRPSVTTEQTPPVLTNGAFLIKQYTPGTYMSMVRNPHYRGEMESNLDQIEISMRPEGGVSAVLEQYALKQVDIIDLSARPCLELENIRRIYGQDLIVGPLLSTCITGFDLSQGPFNDRRIRKAFAKAIDLSQLATKALRGVVFPAKGGFVPPAVPSHNMEAGMVYDPEEARRLIAAAGYPEGKGFPTLRAMLLDSVEFRLIKDFLQEQWKETLGVESEWLFAPNYPFFLDCISREKPHLVVSQWIAIYADPDYFLRIGVEDSRSFTHWECPEYDRLIEEAAKCVDQKDKQQIYMKADQLLLDEVAVIPLFYSCVNQLVRPAIVRANRLYPLHLVWKNLYKAAD